MSGILSVLQKKIVYISAMCTHKKLYWQLHEKNDTRLAFIGSTPNSEFQRFGRISNRKVVAFDLDYTIIKPVKREICKIFPGDDFLYVFDNMNTFFNEKLLDDYELIIISNKNAYKHKLIELMTFMEKIFKRFTFPLTVFCLLGEYRKPCVNLIEDFFTPELAEFVFIGDADGKEPILGNADINFVTAIAGKHKCNVFFFLPQEWYNFTSEYHIAQLAKEDNIWRLGKISNQNNFTMGFSRSMKGLQFFLSEKEGFMLNNTIRPGDYFNKVSFFKKPFQNFFFIISLIIGYSCPFRRPDPAPVPW